MRSVMVVAGAIPLWLALGSPILAQDTRTTASGAESPTLRLSPKLRGALVAEMIGLKEGIAELAASLTTGEWDRAAVPPIEIALCVADAAAEAARPVPRVGRARGSLSLFSIPGTSARFASMLAS